MISKPTPAFSRQYRTNHSSGYAKCFCDSLLFHDPSRVPFANANYVSRRQLHGLSAFCGGIFDVVAIVSKKQMVWINTPSVITMMTNVHAVCNWPIGQLIRKAMSESSFSVQPNLPIPVRVCASIPDIATSFVNIVVFLKPIRHWWIRRNSAPGIAIASAASKSLRGDISTTMFAGRCHGVEFYPSQSAFGIMA